MRVTSILTREHSGEIRCLLVGPFMVDLYFGNHEPPYLFTQVTILFAEFLVDEIAQTSDELSPQFLFHSLSAAQNPPETGKHFQPRGS